jgi:hypothetical protein
MWEAELLGHKLVNAAIGRHLAMLHEATQTAVFLAVMAQQRIIRHVRATKERVHLHQTKADCRHLNQYHFHLECHLWHLVTILDLNVTKPTVCPLDMCVYMLLCLALNLSILVHMLRKANMIKIIIQIC